MKFGNPHHAHEGPLHREGKERSTNMALAGGADAVFFEKGGSDGLAVKRINGNEYRVGIEFERSPRNVVRNITRDIEELDCAFVVVVAVSELMCLAIIRCLNKHLPDKYQNRVLVMSAKRISENVFSKIFNVWLHAAGAVNAITERRHPVSAD